ncbi:MAG: OmpA family protein [Elusimicrobia bacterium]|nr:OmpA family protein [Elusimicrobiota bacterium]
MTPIKRPSWIVSLCCAALALAVACAPKKTVRKSGDETDTAARADEKDLSVESGEVNIRGSEFQKVPELQPIHFAYDAYSLTEESRKQLRQNVEYLKGNQDLEILVAGHCDERGTIAYNLALGQRRAKAVREYYIRLGIRGKSIATLSYGKEKPLCAEHTEDCWTTNRRAETTVRARTVSNHHRPEDAETPQ